MLSFIYRLATDFEQAHAVRPNILYLNPTHMAALRESFATPDDLDKILEVLGMDIILEREIVHPQVAWTPTARARAV